MTDFQQQAREILDQPATAQTILANLPERIRAAFIARAAEINYPVEAVVEIALAGYLDSKAIGFVDCKPDQR
jgi:hypothetical protein